MTENISLKNETFEKHPDYGGFITHGGHHRVHGSFMSSASFMIPSAVVRSSNTLS